MSNIYLKFIDIHRLCAIQCAIERPRLPACVTGLLLGGSAGLLAGEAGAQAPRFVELTAERLPALAGRCMDAAAGDADGDGDLDIALAMEFEPNVLLLNDGAGRFDDASDRLPRAIHDSEDVAFADLDADGDLDLVLVSEDDRTDELYLNDGSGRFGDASERLPTDEVSNALAVLDLDGDGDLDVLLGNEGQNELFMNIDGRLVDETAARLPRRADETREIRAADVDRDGDPDLVVANVSFVMEASAQDDLLINDGSGVFTAAEPSRFPEDARSNFTVQVADLDADGDPDVLAPATVFSPTGAGDYLVLLNDGNGNFTVAGPGAFLPVTARGNGFDIEVADFDGDGADELLLCNRASGGDAARSGGVLRLLAREAG